MGRRPVDLFDDPPWPTAVPLDRAPVQSPRPWLLASATPRRLWTSLCLLLASVLALAVILEVVAQLSVNPGPPLHADGGAWIGAAAAVLAWSCVAAATWFAYRAR